MLRKGNPFKTLCIRIHSTACKHMRTLGWAKKKLTYSIYRLKWTDFLRKQCPAIMSAWVKGVLFDLLHMVQEAHDFGSKTKFLLGSQHTSVWGRTKVRRWTPHFTTWKVNSNGKLKYASVDDDHLKCFKNHDLRTCTCNICHLLLSWLVS